MILISDDDIKRNHEAFLKKLKEGSGTILESSYLSKTFPKYERKCARTYPYTVKIPKSLQELAQGDFEPAYQFEVKEPFKGLHSNIWFGDSSSGVNLHCGYVDGNSSQPSSFVLGDKDVHMIVAGATGQGKSVVLNSIIFGFCLEYAPWEVDLTLCDTKIVEFKSYALQTPMPHIRRIAATDDTDYILSVIETLKGEINLLNAAFARADVKKIEDFRKKTGLCVPQHIIIIDEFQNMFLNAKKKAGKISDLIDAFARVGRNAGYHLILASQEVGSDIKKETLSNIKLRACLGCNGSVSEKILGNADAAKNYGQPGKLIINNQPVEKDNSRYNTNIVVPFMPDNERLALGTDVINSSAAIKYNATLSFFDSEVALLEEDYDNYLDSFERKNRILLGPPSYVINGPEQVVTLDLTGKDIENIIVLTPGNANNERYFKMLMSNVCRIQGAQSIISCLDDVFIERCHAEQYAIKSTYFNVYEDFQNNGLLELAFVMFARRKLCLEIDNKVFTSTQKTDKYLDEFYKYFAKGSDMDTEINRQRFECGMYLLSEDKTLKTISGLSEITNRDELAYKTASKVYEAVDSFRMYNSAVTQLALNNMPPLFVWILGMDKMRGLGRDNRTANVTKLKNVLLDCSKYNIRFIMFTNTLEDMKELTKGVRWCIVDGVAEKEYRYIEKVSTDDFPEQVGPLLATVTDQLGVHNKVSKFKKLQLTGEFLL